MREAQSPDAFIARTHVRVHTRTYTRILTWALATVETFSSWSWQPNPKQNRLNYKPDENRHTLPYGLLQCLGRNRNSRDISIYLLVNQTKKKIDRLKKVTLSGDKNMSFYSKGLV